MTLQSREQLGAGGLSRGEIERQLSVGEITRVRRGAYAPGGDLDAKAAHLRLAEATWSGLQPGAALSHFSAALAHGLPVPAGQLKRVWITRPGSAGGRQAGLVRLVRSDLGDDDCTVSGPFTVTSLERTAADCALYSDLPDALMIMDAALRNGASPTVLAELAASWTGRHGIGVLRRAIALGDPRSESPGESRSRALFALYGLPMPELQVVVGDAEDAIARVDFLWREQRLVGEFDGRVKYGRDMAPGGDPAKAVWLEKLREDKLRQAGFRVERWIWADTVHPAAFIARLRRVLAQR